MNHSRPDSLHGSREHEARLLSVMLRTSRLSWVFAAPGADRTGLLKTGVLPMMQRRRSDRASGTPLPASPPACGERRNRVANAAAPRGEIAIYVDNWDEKPLSRLKARIDDVVPAPKAGALRSDQRLATILHDINSALGLQCIFMFNDFDALLARLPDEDEVSRFVDELIDAVLLPGLQASFLICLQEESKARLERFRRRVPDFDHSVLRLLPAASQGEPPEGAAEMSTAPHRNLATGIVTPRRPGVTPRRRGPLPHEPIKLEEVYALIESTLSRTASKPAATEWDLPDGYNADESADGGLLPAEPDELPARARSSNPSSRLADVIRRLHRRRSK